MHFDLRRPAPFCEDRFLTGREPYSISLLTFFQSACSHLCDKNMGNMGKKPANTCIPRWVVCCTGMQWFFS